MAILLKLQKILGAQSVREMALVVLLLTMGIAARLVPMLRYNYWLDEQATYYFATQTTTWQQLLTPADNRPPLYYLYVHFLTALTSDGFLLRAPNLIFSLATSLILFQLFRKKDKILAFGVLFLTLFSPAFIDIAWQLRDYVVLVFFTALLIAQFEKMKTQDQLSRKDFFQFFFVALLGSLTSYIFLIELIAGWASFFITDWRKKTIKWHKREGMILIGLSEVAVGISFIFLMQQFVYLSESLGWLTRTYVGIQLWKLRIFTNAAGLTADLQDNPLTNLPTLLMGSLIVLGIFACALILLRRQSLSLSLKKIFIFQGWWFVFGVTGVFALTYISGLNFGIIPRYFSLVITHFTILLAGTWAILQKYFPKKMLLLVLILYGAQLGLLYIKTYNPFALFITHTLSWNNTYITQSREMYYHHYSDLATPLLPRITSQDQLVYFPLRRGRVFFTFYFRNLSAVRPASFMLMEHLENCAVKRPLCFLQFSAHDLPNSNKIIILLENSVLQKDRENGSTELEFLPEIETHFCQTPLQTDFTTDSFTVLVCPL